MCEVTMSPHPLGTFATPGIMTDPGEYGYLFDGLPREPDALCGVVQGLLLHVFWAERLGATLTEARRQEVGIRTVSAKLARLQALCDEALAVARPLDARLVGNCRDFSLLLCAMLRHQGIPARARCGFGAYFEPDRYEDHWVCEVWNAQQERWVLVDAQLDTFQQEALELAFNPLDVPRDQFLVAGLAWQLCRAGQADPDRFGIFDMHGLWFVRGNLVRDFLALNKIEILPWDGWGLISAEDEALSADDLALLDRIASLTLAGDEAWPEICTLYRQDDRLRMPDDWPHD
jgi:hypothetical protein